MAQYTAKRILQFIPVLLGVTLAMFFLTTHLPGADPVQLKLGQKRMSPAVHEQLVHQLGLDRPWYEQYTDYLVDLAQGDWGRSLRNGRPVSEIIGDAYPWTLKLAFGAIVVEIVLGLGAGIISALRQRSFWDVLIALTTTILVALPVFWLGFGLQYTFGIWLKELTGGALYLPTSGTTGPFPSAAYYILPAITMGVVSAAAAARLTRAELVEAKGQDYVRTAVAKGVSSRDVMSRHVMRNALIPVVTFIALDFAAMLGGAVLVEGIFNWPGVGYVILNATRQRDYPVLIGGTTFLLIVVMIVNLAVDMSYGLLDPRVRTGGGQGGMSE